MRYRALFITDLSPRYLRFIVRYLLAGLLLGAVLNASAQARTQDLIAVQDKTVAAVERHIDRINRDMQETATRSLLTMEATEKGIVKKLMGKDPVKAAALQNDLRSHYDLCKAMLEAGEQRVPSLLAGRMPLLDSLQVALAFLKEGHSPYALLNKTGLLQQTVSRREAVGKLLEQRRRMLEELLVKYSMPRQLKNLRNQIATYRASLHTYKAKLSDPAGIESSLVALVRQAPQFRSFFQTHSQLSALMPMGIGTPGDASGKLSAGQSREAVMESLVRRKGSAETIYQALQQTVTPSLESELNRRLSALRKGQKGRGEELPQTSSDHASKKRLVYGMNVQTGKGNRFYPASADIGFTLGYRIQANTIAGMGVSYTTGLVQDLRKFRISNEGIGLRTFVDHRVNGRFWISAGADLNYRHRFRNAELFRSHLLWQKSAWVAIGKTYRVSNRFRGRMQLVYDALWKQQVPASQPVSFRLGYQWH